MIRLVRVTPIWAPESWVDRDRSARRTPSACRSPSLAAFSTAARSTATRAYSAAPKTPHASTRPTEIPSSSHSMLPIVAGRPNGDVRPATRAGGLLSAAPEPWEGRRTLERERGEAGVEVLRCRREPRRTGAQRQRGLRLSRPHLHARRRRGRWCCRRRDRLGDRGVRRLRAGARGPAGRSGRRCCRAGVRLAQEQIAAGVRRDPARTGMATTLTALATDGERFGLAHVGDSRGYVFRDGRLTRLTRDHTYVQRLVDEGNLPAEDVAVHPWRHVVLRSVNGTVDELGDVAPVSLAVGDRVLLASDGLTDLVTERADREPASSAPRRRRCGGAARRRARCRRPRQHHLPAGDGHRRSRGGGRGDLVGAAARPAQRGRRRGGADAEHRLTNGRRRDCVRESAHERDRSSAARGFGGRP